MTPDDPRHGSNAGYLTHYRDHEPVCQPCREARHRMRKRNAFARYRGEQILYGAPELAAVLSPWIAMGLTNSAIAVAAGMCDQTTTRITAALKGDGPLRRETFRRLASITEDDLAPNASVYSDLTRRRIYSLMAAGHRLKDMPVNMSGQWRKKDRVAVHAARAVRAHYQLHEFSMGPDPHTMARARNAGHNPPLSWDDPGTLAWPKEAPIPSRLRDTDDNIDQTVVDRILNGENLPATKAERIAVCRQWAARGRVLNDLERLTGWRVYRYFQLGDAA